MLCALGLWAKRNFERFDRRAVYCGMNEYFDNDYERDDDVGYSYAEVEQNERLDYASHVRASKDWRDAGEIAMGA